MENFESSWLSLLPPLLAILLAIVTRQVIISLLSGILLAAAMLAKSFTQWLELSSMQFIVDPVADKGHIQVILFSLFISGMVAVLHQNGSMTGLVTVISKWVKSAKSALFATWGLGILVFFDDYANTMIVGNTMKQVTDKYKIPREKLAYIVDSTAAPVAVIAFVTTWIGAELGYISQGLTAAQLNLKEYSLFLGSLSYSFYPLITLIFIFVLIYLQMDYGPMSKAKWTKPAQLSKTSKTSAPIWAVIPVLTLLGVTIITLWYSGYDPSKNQSLGDIIGNGDSYKAILWGAMASLSVAILSSVGLKLLSLSKSIEAMINGFKKILETMVILVLSWGLGLAIEKLGTATYLTSVIDGSISVEWLPVLLFVVSALVAFTTGTSWGTMAIMIPSSIQIIATIAGKGQSSIELESALHMGLASILGGAVFGDHCSPISDTTILSSMATDCNHISHVKTQLPYAITVAVLTIICLSMCAIGIPAIVSFFLGLAIMVGFLLFVKKAKLWA